MIRDSPHSLAAVLRRLNERTGFDGSAVGFFGPCSPFGGTFTRFSDDELRSRYTSRRQYVERVRRAVDHLAAKGYISNQDRKVLIAAARHEPLL